MQILSEAEWRPVAEAHAARADALTAAHRDRRARGIAHPVEDFLFTYYSLKPAQLSRWHPGAGVALAGAAAERAGWRYYRAVPEAAAGGRAGGAGDAAGSRARTVIADAAASTPADPAAETAATVDVAAFFAGRGATVDYVADLLRRTRDRAPQLGCFGLHEWAMVYRQTPETLRHRGLRLRIGHAASDRVVEQHRIACSHFDAFRFFTPEAAPLNRLRPTRDTQPALEQPGCLHAGMDLYKWAGKLGPIVPGALLLASFELARDIRRVDMRASPYDVSDFGLAAIPIETAAGKREYAALQRRFAERGNALRDQLLGVIAAARSCLAGGTVRSTPAHPAHPTDRTNRTQPTDRTDPAHRTDRTDRELVATGASA